MGLTIQSAAEFPLEPAADRSVALPGIVLLPTPENMPHVKKFEVEITGRSTPLSQEAEVDRIAEKLKLGYPKLDYRPGKEVALRQQMTVPLSRVFLDERIPAGARFNLAVQVWYYDSDAQGRPNAAAGLKGPVKATSLLLAAGQHSPSGPPVVAGACRVEAEPAELTLVDRGDTAELTVRITSRPPDAPPRLVLADAYTDAPELEAGLKALLAEGLKRSAEDRPDAAETWRASWALQLVPAARRQLWERTQSGSLEVTVRVEVPGRAAAEVGLRLLCQEDVFKGLIAIDFGTSNSTA